MCATLFDTGHRDVWEGGTKEVELACLTREILSVFYLAYVKKFFAQETLMLLLISLILTHTEHDTSYIPSGNRQTKGNTSIVITYFLISISTFY